MRSNAGADPGFQVRGAHLKKLRRAEGGAKMFGVFRVKNPPLDPPLKCLGLGILPIHHSILYDLLFYNVFITYMPVSEILSLNNIS
jgi:hypothetical protein